MSNAYRIAARKAAAGVLLAGCLTAAPAFSQEIIKWVDADGVTHFGHAATAARQAVQEHMQDKVEPAEAATAGQVRSAQREATVEAAELAANTSPRVAAGWTE